MARGNGKKKTLDLAASADPKAPFDSNAFLAATRPVLKALAEDLLARAHDEGVALALTEQHELEVKGRRTADPYEVWRRRIVGQIACHWLLSLVFVRTLEDRGLLDRNRIAGPGALDAQKLFFQFAPYLTERDYLLAVFRELMRIPAAEALFDRHNLVWRLSPSADAARSLLQLFRNPGAEAPAFRFGQSDTRFLGDLYQDLDDDVRERYALLQTPRFVESFILDRTLERSVEEFGLDATTLIDPTCGSGHFLLGAFERLYEHRLRAQPGIEARQAVELALQAVHGTDINPYSIAIARFRLALTAWEKCGITCLVKAPKLEALATNLATVDSLLFRVGIGQLGIDEKTVAAVRQFRGALFEFQDLEIALPLLQKRFTAVVGNPPYITVKDASLREEYRKLYKESATGKYALSAPFAQRFFELAAKGGFVGQITANSFIQREFGKPLVEKYLPTVNLELIVNTSGAYIPGHGTPTVLLFGTHEQPQRSNVQAVLAKRGEPSTPALPDNGLVWRSIADHWAHAGFENEYISISKLERSTLNKHPWSLGGGGARELKELLEDRSGARLGDIVKSIGFMAITGEDDAFARPKSAWLRQGIPSQWLYDFGIGEEVRDWSISSSLTVAFPYKDARLRDPSEFPELSKALWPLRTTLLNRPDFGGKKYRDVGRSWHEFHQVPLERLRNPFSISFAFVATHNHFAFDRGGKVFNRTAPIIKLRDDATEEEHLALLAYLNSSTACFWMRHTCVPRGSNHGSAANSTPFLMAHEFDGTKLKQLPLPDLTQSATRSALASFGRRIDALMQDRTSMNFSSAAADETPLRDAIKAIIERRASARAIAMSLQEELDWLVYTLFQLAPSTCGPIETVKPIRDGERPFEILLHYKKETGAAEWFSRNNITPTEKIPNHLPLEQQNAYTQRLRAIETSTNLALIEAPAFKRRWIQVSGKASQQLETDRKTLGDQAMEWLETQAELAIAACRNVITIRELVKKTAATSRCAETADFLGLIPDIEYQSIANRQSVPFLSTLRYGDAGLEKRAAWERTWELQRLEDLREYSGPICPPTKYEPSDFLSIDVYRLRGRLDVPKERFISYPGCESDEERSPVYGWAGWNHLQQAQALASLYQKRKTEEAWGKERLTPMLAGIEELVPWVKQWHNEPNEEYGGLRLGDYFAGFVDEECRALGLTKADLKAWRPEAKRAAKKAKAAATADSGTSIRPAAKAKSGAKSGRRIKASQPAPAPARDVAVEAAAGGSKRAPGSRR